MRFEILREALLRPLQLVAGAVDKKQSMPVLSSVCMGVTAEGVVSLTATDLEIELSASLRLELGEAFEPGEVIIPARKFMDICRALPEGVLITIAQEKGKVILMANQTRFVLATLSVESFPRIEEEVGAHVLSIPKATLSLLLEQVSFAMAQQDVRYYMNGLLFVFEPTGIRVVATDGHRLATTQVPMALALSEKQSIILPRKAVVELSRLLSESDVDLELTFGQHCLRVTALQYRFTTKLIDGKFPPYTQVLPQSVAHVAFLKKELFKEALMRASVLFSDRFRGAGLLFQEGKLTILASNQDKDEAQIQLEIEYSGPDIEIGFNISYIVEYLNTVRSPLVRMGMNSASSGVLFEAIAEDSHSLYVVMPMRI